MTAQHFAFREAWLGRLLLLGSAYAPIGVIVGLRLLPSGWGWAAMATGVVGFLAWAVALVALPRLGPRETPVTAVQSVDAEITAYIATYLLPVLAADSPGAGEVGGYVICAIVILVVAYTADIGVVNPVLYLLGYRVFRAAVDGRMCVVIAHGVPAVGGRVNAVRGFGLILVLDTLEEMPGG